MSILTDAKDALSLFQELQNIWRKRAFIFIIVVIEIISEEKVFCCYNEPLQSYVIYFKTVPLSNL